MYTDFLIYMLFLCFINKYMNNGQPMNAVITPTGRNVGAIMTLDTRSATINNTAPKAADAESDICCLILKRS